MECKKVRMKRAKRKNQGVVLVQGKRDNIKPLTKLRSKEPKRDKEAVSSVFQTNITDAYKRQLSSNQCKEQMMVN